MDIKLTSENRVDYLLIESKGILQSLAELTEHGQMIYTEIAKYDCKKVLVMDVETRFPKDIFVYQNLAGNYEEKFPIDLKSIKVAVVVTEEFKDIGEFWQTVCTNRGFDFAAFTAEEDALLWLLQ